MVRKLIIKNDRGDFLKEDDKKKIREEFQNNDVVFLDERYITEVVEYDELDYYTNR